MSRFSHPTPFRAVFPVVAGVLIAVVGTGVALVAQGRRDFDVVARKYAYRVSGSDRAEIRVLPERPRACELLDRGHSAQLHDRRSGNSHYRIMRRAEPGKPVSFDFRADTAGRFRFYCSLTIDEKCREMQGTLIVEPKQ